MDYSNTLKNNKTAITPKFYLSLPVSSGVYIYWDEVKPIYVGKAINLKNRVTSYFRLNLDIKTQRMISEARRISYIEVTSELEALLLESKLIRKIRPKYNVIAKDDKHPLYIEITKDKFPYVKTARGQGDFGPFLSSDLTYSILRMIRKLIPFCDHKLGKKACLYSHIGLCDPCPNTIKEADPNYQLLRKKYLRNTRRVRDILNGRFKKLRSEWEKEMNSLSKLEKYEQASQVRDKVSRLDYITSPKIPGDSFLENPNLAEDLHRKELKELNNLLKKAGMSVKNLSRIECFDIAHLSGNFTTASMVTFVDAKPDKGMYRNFKVRNTKKSNDYASMEEIGKRRANNLKNWGIADLIIVDGSLGQIKSFKTGLNKDVPIVGIAKNPDRLVINSETKIKLEGSALHLVARIRDEAHRFARRYHHKLHIKNMLLLSDEKDNKTLHNK